MDCRPIIAIATLFLLFAANANAQTCSCASVPLLGAMESGSPVKNQWFLASTYEFHDISELVSGSSSIPDQTGRDRTAEALIFEASHGLTEKWAFSAIIAAVRHERDVGGQADTASGLGDAILMVKYSPSTISLYSKSALSFGLGSQLPVGRNDVQRQGITLSEDLQPSTGAYAGIAWAYYARALNDSRSARIYSSASYTSNGTNDRKYRFGNETMASIGASYQTQSPWGFNLELVYQRSDRDERASTPIPNTGGEWIDIVPAAQYHINEKLALRAAAKIPVSRHLNDQLQFTTKYAFRLSLSYLLGGDD